MSILDDNLIVPTKRTIGFIDDDEGFLEELKTEIEDKFSLNAYYSSNIKDAIDWVENAKIDTIISDLRMSLPLNGIELLSIIRKMNHNIELIMLTGFVLTPSEINICQALQIHILYKEEGFENVIQNILYIRKESSKIALLYRNGAPKISTVAANLIAPTEKTIGFIDDQEGFLEGLKSEAEGGFSLKAYYSTKIYDAISWVENSQIDTLISALRMPFNGIELLSLIRKMDDNIELVLLTGFVLNPSEIQICKALQIRIMFKEEGFENIIQNILYIRKESSKIASHYRNDGKSYDLEDFNFEKFELPWGEEFPEREDIRKYEDFVGLYGIDIAFESELSVKKGLEKIALNAKVTLKADSVILYKYKSDSNNGEKIHPFILQGDLYDDDALINQYSEENVQSRVIRHGSDVFASDVKKNKIFGGGEVWDTGSRKIPRFEEREKIQSCAAMLLKAKKKITGIMFINYRTKQHFTPQQKKLIKLFANQTSIAIRISDIVEESKEEVNRIRTSTEVSEKDILKVILDKAFEFTDIYMGYIGISNKEKKNTKIVVCSKKYEKLLDESINIFYQDRDWIKRGEKFDIYTRNDKKGDYLSYVLHPDLLPDLPEIIFAEGKDVQSALRVPIYSGKELLGLIVLESKKLDAFSRIDAYAVSSLANQAAIFIGNIKKDGDMDTLADNETLSADFFERELRKGVSNRFFVEGRSQWLKAIAHDVERKERLINEFGYIYNLSNTLEEDEKEWKRKEVQIEWRRKVGWVLSEYNDFILDSVEEEETDTDRPVQKQENETFKTSEPNYQREGKTSVQLGSELETPVLKLFEKFLTMCREEFKIDILKKRRQPSGFQFGYDLEFACQIEGEGKLKLRIECKNYANELKLDTIAGKLATAKLHFSKDPIDHWIVISPFATVATDLNQCLNSWEHTNDYPFKVQVWNQETGVDQFFGLVPEIYDIFFKPPDGGIHPKDWSEEKKQEVLEFWKQKLEPPLQLPQGWEQYILNPHNLMLEPKETEFEQKYNNNYYIETNCKDETGAVLLQTLGKKIYEWLEEPVTESPALFLLGEFGDGKTFFTYTITRKLIEKFKQSPKNHWLPVRFALKNFESEGFKSTQDFLQHRLNDFNANIAGWNELRTKGFKILTILDGFDEISKELDPDTIQKNIEILINCFESDYFSGMKLLITSRKHFFENHKEKDQLIDKLDKPQLLHLAPFDRKTTEDYLRTYAAAIGEEEKFSKLKDCHDPIEMASKPLFLDMVQVSLKDLPEEDLNEYKLYETYILRALKRKRKYHYDKRKETPKDKIIENLLNLLELVAQTLHRSNREFVYLSDIRGKTDLKEWLWDLSDPEKETTEDETARAATRSLLKRIDIMDQSNNKQWPVDFCHRSMREYFVARAVCDMLEKNLEEVEGFLKKCFLSHEILFFANEIMKNRNFDYESNLLHLVGKTRNAEKIDRINLGYLGGNAINLLYKYKGKLPGYNWKNLILDGAILPNADLSGKDFSGTSLQFANLDNVNFTGSNFSHCNLTEVRIEETTPVQSIAISTNEKILALYHDGVIREWSYHRLHGATSTNLSVNITEKEMKLIAYPGNDLTILHGRNLFFYDRYKNKFELKAAIEIKSNIQLLKANSDYLLLKEENGKQNRLILVDLNKQTIVKSIMSLPFTLCDHLENHAVVIFNENEELQVIDITPEKRTELVISVEEKVSCIAVCKCRKSEGQYLLACGLYNGTVQIWKIRMDQWEREKLLGQLLHKQKQPVKDISFIDEYRIVTGGLDGTIQLFKIKQDGKPVGIPQEFKMALQCRGMKVEGVIREKIEQKKLHEFIENAI